MLSEIIKTFDKVAHSYDEWYKHPQGKKIFLAELKGVNSLIPEKGVGLELGAGTGIFAHSLTLFKRPIVCLDPSKEMLKQVKKRKIFGIIGVGGFLPFREKIFNFTYMITVLEFLENPEKVLREIRYTTEGCLCILFINKDSSWGNFYSGIGQGGDPVFSNARLYTVPEVESLLRREGYVITEKIGTITTPPPEKKVGSEYEEPSNKTGVIIVKAVRHGEKSHYHDA